MYLYSKQPWQTILTHTLIGVVIVLFVWHMCTLLIGVPTIYTQYT